MDPSPDAPTGVWHPAWSAEQGTEYATAMHVDAFGSRPRGTWSAPARVTVIGEHTDFNGGPTLATVLPHGSYVAASPRDDDELHISCDGFTGDSAERWSGPLSAIDPESVHGCTAVIAGTVWALMERGHLGGGLNIAVRSCVPVGAGLAENAATQVAVARAVNSLWGLGLDDAAGAIELADACVDAENEIARGFAGGLDQFSAAFGEQGRGLLLDFATYPPRVADGLMNFGEYGLGLLVVDTGAREGLGDGRTGQRRAQCKAAARALGLARLSDLVSVPDASKRIDALADDTLRRRARHVVSEIRRVRTVAAELESMESAVRRFATIGQALSDSHFSLRDDFEVTCPELDLAVETALTSGALGARMVGGGFGGCVIALVRKSHAQRKAAAITQAFADAGFAAPTFLAFEASRVA